MKNKINIIFSSVKGLWHAFTGENVIIKTQRHENDSNDCIDVAGSAADHTKTDHL